MWLTRARIRRRTILTVGALLCLSGVAFAQRFFFGGEEGRDVRIRNGSYDGRFTFTRLKYTTAPGGYWYQGLPSWAHGYPLSEDNLIRIMNEITYLGGRTDAFNVLSLDDEDLAKYPISYITEAGWWTMTDHEAAAFRAYLLKGGFVIFDDFKMPGESGTRRRRLGDVRNEHEARAARRQVRRRWTSRTRFSTVSSRSSR